MSLEGSDYLDASKTRAEKTKVKEIKKAFRTETSRYPKHRVKN